MLCEFYIVLLSDIGYVQRKEYVNKTRVIENVQKIQK